MIEKQFSSFTEPIFVNLPAHQNLITQYLSVFTVIQGQVAENAGIFLAEVEQGHPLPPCLAHTVNKCHFRDTLMSHFCTVC